METQSERERQYWIGYERMKAKATISCTHAKDGNQKILQPFPYYRIERHEARIQELVA